MIPVARRTVTVNVSNVFDFPFGCASCGIATTAHVTAAGEGRARSAYVAPNEQSARDRAHANAQGKAYDLLASCPCPECGAHSENQRQANAEWARTAPSKKKLADGVLLLGFIIVAVVSVGACANGANTAVDPMFDHGLDMLNTTYIAYAVKEALVKGVAALIVGLFFVGVVYGALAPKAEPKLLPNLPEGLWFDPPQVGYNLAAKAAIAACPRPDVQIAGEPCAACGRSIVFEHQGVACEECAAPVHDACHDQHASEQHALASGIPFASDQA